MIKAIKKNNSLYDRFSKKGFYPTHVAEVGVYHPETSTIYEYLQNDVRCTLVEPDPSSISLIKDKFKNNKHLTLYEVAIFDYNGYLELIKKDASSFVSEMEHSPARINDDVIINKADRFRVESKTFDQIDDGTIDLLSVDVEGCEWFVIKHMISQPHIISLETHGGIYINPYIKEILDWMSENKYVIYYKTKSDTIFVQKEKFEILFKDKLNLLISNILISSIRIKKKLKKSFMSHYNTE